jgi:hypothetical protein
MATQTNVPQSVEQSKLTVVPFPAPQAITQLEVTILLSARSPLATRRASGSRRAVHQSAA